ncbi:transcription elongation factor GreB [Alsobacter metallidurans]|uniref:Transcription elongation factor GreB n=1 Tax=Alsobacter metallidurans TaxID=340221 RepID=A0A917I6W9_9HYPH|nr:transcription elongation factor GreA [Alsobacter metallidurans]GGH17773.1 transcription elongation factor GreB [Alsobacter metallidurans]
MSRAFVKEQDGGEAFEDLPDRPVSPHPNLVTPEGLRAIEETVERLRREHGDAQAAGDRPTVARTARDLRYWQHRLSNAEVVQPSADAQTVHFGATVTIERDDGRKQTWRIVGEDEADPAHGTLPHVAPLAQALLGKSVGDTVEAGHGEAEIIAIG